MKISLKGLAKYMTSGFATQRKILRNFKYPDPEGFAQAIYYADARRAIRDYHSRQNDPTVLLRAVDKLQIKASRSHGSARTRHDHNIRAIQSYSNHFHRRKFAIQSNPRLDYSHGKVVVSCMPDLYVTERGREKIIKLELGADAPDPKMLRIILQVLYEAAKEAGLPVRPQDVICLDASRAIQHKGARLRTRMKTEVEAACQNIEVMWATIKR